MEYIAFGEVLFEEHSSSFSSPYLFNGKELDRETNLSYYGARYLDMKTSLWLTTDPKMEKYPHESSYIYCGNNPIAFVDPDGMDRIYSASGRLIRDTGVGTKIMIQTKHGLRYLSGLDYTKKGTRYAVSRIIAKEASLRCYGGYYGVRNMDEENTGAYTNRANTIWTNTKQLRKGTITPL
ncbi:RHS repeat-associated core domain-containing protein [Flavobacterium sp. B11]|uniref:RHS repeat-associated core domain-containing protein n=1 Tax=Flavobacterium movens TaxID=214860 RepID=UPI0031D86876